MAQLASLAAEVTVQRGLEPSPSRDLRDRSYYAFPSSFTKQDGSRRGFCNWLVRDALMVGRYPFCDPTPQCPSREEGRAHLLRMLDAGISCFVCLQAELPPQNGPAGPHWPPEGVRHDVGFFSGNFLPYGAIVADEAGALGQDPPRMLHFPIMDMGVPTRDQLLRVVEQLLGELGRGGRLYVHCWGGQGRAATISACLLAALCPQYSAEEVLICTQAGFDSREGGQDVESPQTQEQRELVRKFTVMLRGVQGQ